MPSLFDSDPYPGKPRILFVGLAESTHTHAWIDLLREAELNVRLFALPTPSGYPPDDWPIPTYVSGRIYRRFDRANRRIPYLYGGKAPGIRHLCKTGNLVIRRLFQPERWLASILNDWQPHVVHTLGLDPAGMFLHRVLRSDPADRAFQWVLQLRGGSDLTLSHLDPDQRTGLADVLGACDQILSDNRENFRIGGLLGLREEQIAPIAPVPGTGGVALAELQALATTKPSARRVIVWPKAYVCPWSLSLPVLEALQLCWDAIAPCEVYMTAADETTRMWYWTLPERMREHCHLLSRVPRRQMLDLMASARVALLPSLVDGTPNSMFEAMACGALPIVSPLPTLTPLVEDPLNVLFARNLYPDEIASALRRAMTDDALVEAAAIENETFVRRYADRATLAPKVVAYYLTLVQQAGQSGTVR